MYFRGRCPQKWLNKVTNVYGPLILFLVCFKAFLFKKIRKNAKKNQKKNKNVKTSLQNLKVI